MEYVLWAINSMLCLMLLFMALHAFSVGPLLIVAVLHWPGNWILRATGRHDPAWTTVYYNSLARPLVRPPHSHANNP